MKVILLQFFFFFKENFNLWYPLLMIILYNQIKTSINFWCWQRLNPKSFIQPTEILLIKLTGTHKHYFNYSRYCFNYNLSSKHIVKIIMKRVVPLILTNLWVWVCYYYYFFNLSWHVFMYNFLKFLFLK